MSKQSSIRALLLRTELGRSFQHTRLTLDGSDRIKVQVWSELGNRVANRNVELKSTLVYLEIIRWYSTSPRHFVPSRRLQSVQLPPPFAWLSTFCKHEGLRGRVAAELNHALSFVFEGSMWCLSFNPVVWTVLIVCSSTWFLISHLRSGADMSSTVRFSWAIKQKQRAVDVL